MESYTDWDWRILFVFKARAKIITSTDQNKGMNEGKIIKMSLFFSIIIISFNCLFSHITPHTTATEMVWYRTHDTQREMLNICIYVEIYENGREKNNIIYIKSLYVSLEIYLFRKPLKEKGPPIFSFIEMRVCTNENYCTIWLCCRRRSNGKNVTLFSVYMLLAENENVFAPALAFFSPWREKKEKKLFFFSFFFCSIPIHTLWCYVIQLCVLLYFKRCALSETNIVAKKNAGKRI
jgi:hypothetical protein